MRIAIPFVALFVLSLAFEPVCAFGHEDKIPDPESIQALEAQASQAKPRDQYFLYAQLVHEMTELSAHQYASGDVTLADRMLREIQRVVKKVHVSLAHNDKHLINAQILLNNTSFRLTEMLHASNYEDQPLVKETLTQVDQAQREAMLQVFEK